METIAKVASVNEQSEPTVARVTARPRYTAPREEPLIQFGDILHVNMQATRDTNQLYLTGAVACLLEWRLKTGQVNDMEALASASNSLSFEEASYLCACACQYLTEEDFKRYLESGAAPADLYTAQDSCDYEFGEHYYLQNPSPQEYRYWMHPDENPETQSGNILH